MKDFEKIDWNAFNRPPYYQQWLCQDDTLKLATFGNKGISDVEDHILDLKKQWDLANVNGRLLDRIGKVFSEQRKGDDDDIYRLRIRLRILLNTCNGTVNDIIKVIKFLYSSEIVHITPKYPAGIYIVHDGEQFNVDFSGIIKEVIGAGIGYETRVVFLFKDLIKISESHSSLVITNNVSEDFSGRLYHNGRILRDGKTIKNTEKRYYRHNGKVSHNGGINHGAAEVPASGSIRLPLRHHSYSILERFILTYGIHPFQDVYYSRLCHDGSVIRDSSVRHNGQSKEPVKDFLSVCVTPNLKDTIKADDKLGFEFSHIIKENYARCHDGSLLRDGVSKHCKTITDTMASKATMSIAEKASGKLLHNKTIMRDGVKKHNRYGNQFAFETMNMWIRKHHYHNGAYIRDGSIARDGMVLQPLE